MSVAAGGDAAGGDAAGGVATGVGGGLAIVRHVFNPAYLQPVDWVNALLP